MLSLNPGPAEETQRIAKITLGVVSASALTSSMAVGGAKSQMTDVRDESRMINNLCNLVRRSTSEEFDYSSFSEGQEYRQSRKQS